MVVNFLQNCLFFYLYRKANYSVQEMTRTCIVNVLITAKGLDVKVARLDISDLKTDVKSKFEKLTS
jgi:hypothetical protein